MDEYILKAGTIIKFKGVPVILSEDTKVKTETQLDKLPIKGEGNQNSERNPYSNN